MNTRYAGFKFLTDDGSSWVRWRAFPKGKRYPAELIQAESEDPSRNWEAFDTQCNWGSEPKVKDFGHVWIVSQYGGNNV